MSRTATIIVTPHNSHDEKVSSTTSALRVPITRICANRYSNVFHESSGPGEEDMWLLELEPKWLALLTSDGVRDVVEWNAMFDGANAPQSYPFIYDNISLPQRIALLVLEDRVLPLLTDIVHSNNLSSLLQRTADEDDGPTDISIVNVALQLFAQRSGVFRRFFLVYLLRFAYSHFELSYAEYEKLLQDFRNNIAEVLTPELVQQLHLDDELAHFLSAIGDRQWLYLLSLPKLGADSEIKAIRHGSFGSRKAMNGNYPTTPSPVFVDGLVMPAFQDFFVQVLRPQDEIDDDVDECHYYATPEIFATGCLRNLFQRIVKVPPLKSLKQRDFDLLQQRVAKGKQDQRNGQTAFVQAWLSQSVVTSPYIFNFDPAWRMKDIECMVRNLVNTPISNIFSLSNDDDNDCCINAHYPGDWEQQVVENDGPPGRKISTTTFGELAQLPPQVRVHCCPLLYLPLHPRHKIPFTTIVCPSLVRLSSGNPRLVIQQLPTPMVATSAATIKLTVVHINDLYPQPPVCHVPSGEYPQNGTSRNIRDVNLGPTFPNGL